MTNSCNRRNIVMNSFYDYLFPSNTLKYRKIVLRNLMGTSLFGILFFSELQTIISPAIEHVKYFIKNIRSLYDV